MPKGFVFGDRREVGRHAGLPTIINLNFVCAKYDNGDLCEIYTHSLPSLSYFSFFAKRKVAKEKALFSTAPPEKSSSTLASGVT